MTDTPMAGPSLPLALIAEDEPLASMALRAQLEALGYDVLGPARDGDEAVVLGVCFPVDVALFDFWMPRRSGLEAAHELFERAPTPVALLTGVGAADLPDPVPEPPIFQVISKPAGLDELRTGLEAARVRFTDWSRNRRTHHGELLRTERETIALATRLVAGDRRLALAAAEMVQRAREEERPLVDVARELLQA